MHQEKLKDGKVIDLHRYDLDDGWIALAGRTDYDNDILSIKIAKPNDFWFHVRGMPGSHVVLHHENAKGEPDKSIIKQAAAIAAWHSKARNGGMAAVSCTQAKNVSKPRRAKPGAVTVRKEKVIKVRPAAPQKK